MRTQVLAIFGLVAAGGFGVVIGRATTASKPPPAAPIPQTHADAMREWEQFERDRKGRQDREDAEYSRRRREFLDRFERDDAERKAYQQGHDAGEVDGEGYGRDSARR